MNHICHSIFNRDSEDKVTNRLVYLKCVVSPFFTPLDIRVTVLDTGKIYILLHCGTASLLHVDLIDSFVLCILKFRLVCLQPCTNRASHGLSLGLLHDGILTSNVCVHSAWSSCQYYPQSDCLCLTSCNACIYSEILTMSQLFFFYGLIHHFPSNSCIIYYLYIGRILFHDWIVLSSNS